MVSQQELDAANAIRDQHEAAQQRIAGRADLSDGARRTLQARAFLTAKRSMDALKVSTADASASRRRQLTGQLFGTDGVTGDKVANATSLRDAQDRARQLKDAGDLGTALSQADDAGDELMARALAQQALSLTRTLPNGGAYIDVLQAFATHRPGSAAKIDELSAITNPTLTTADLYCHALPRPNGLPANDTAVAQAAEDARFADVR